MSQSLKPDNIPIKPKALIDLMRRASKSGYSKILMNNRVLLQCYDTQTDGPQGFHYALPIPETDDYASEFYSKILIICPDAILSPYRALHKEAEDLRKALNLKPKALQEEAFYCGDSIKFTAMVEGASESGNIIEDGGGKKEWLKAVSVQVQSPSETDRITENIVLRYQECLDRIKVGGACMKFNGKLNGLDSFITDSATMYPFEVMWGGKRVAIPMARSMFLGMKTVDGFDFTIQETNIPRVVLFSYSIAKGKLTEILWGYVLI